MRFIYMELKEKQLLRRQAYINGEWTNASNQKTYPVKNPFDRSVLTEVPDMAASDARKAVEAAHNAFAVWKKKPARERAELLRKWFLLMTEHEQDLAQILTLEQGKPLDEALGEIRYGASYIQWFAGEAMRNYGDVIQGSGPDKRILVIKQPVGVVGIITPWNFPNAMISRKLGAALAAGCTVVIKPAEATPLSALAMVWLAELAGFPPGVVNVITTSLPGPVGKELTTNELVRKLSFTGSTQVGKQLMEQCAASLKKVSLELGGNAPFIVFEDADLDAAVKGVIVSKFRNAGQTCVCANRVFVQDTVYDLFTDKLRKAVRNLKVGNGLEADVAIGPLINDKALEKVERLVGDAVKEGAGLLEGGKRHALGGCFYEPTILTRVRHTMEICHQEIFGPVAPILAFSSESEVITMANDTPYGLAAYFYSRDYARIWRISEALEFGMVGINTGMISTPVAPFGGIKESGFGREGSKYGMDDYLEIKYLNIGGVEA